VTNIGTRPTFGQGDRAIEVHLLDFRADLYGKELKLEFIERLREERCFNTPQELKLQINRDVKRAKQILGTGNGA